MRQIIGAEFDIGHGHVGIYVGIDDQERLGAKHRQSTMDAATGLENIVTLLAVNNVEPVAFAGSDMFENLAAQPAEIDNDGFDPARSEGFKVPLDERHALHFDERLRHVLCQRAQPFALACCEDHRNHADRSRPGSTCDSISSTSHSSSS